MRCHQEGHKALGGGGGGYVEKVKEVDVVEFTSSARKGLARAADLMPPKGPME